MSKGQDKTQPIVVKKKKSGHEGHHGGAWKIAFADFMTAMMAFFLLMWLLGSTTKGELMGISEYFQTPLQVALFGGSGSGDSSSIIKGGGEDLTKSHGQVKDGDLDEEKQIINLRAAKVELDLPSRIDLNLDDTKNSGSTENLTIKEQEIQNIELVDAKALEGLKIRIEDLINTQPDLAAFKGQLLLELVDEGLRIQIVDAQNRPMFDVASDQLLPYAQPLIEQIGKSLNEVPYKITISGHTDSTPYKGGEKGYSNWELSSDRANSARRQMYKGGLAENKVIRIVGHASSVPFDRNNLAAPANRRISIVVLKRSAEEKALSDAPALQITTPNPTDVPSIVQQPNITPQIIPHTPLNNN